MAVKDFVTVGIFLLKVMTHILKSGGRRGPRCAGQQTIADNRVVIFSKSYCPYCTRAKDLFATNFPDLHVKVLECVSVLLWLFA
jgi:hypothetical protein